MRQKRKGVRGRKEGGKKVARERRVGRRWREEGEERKR